MKKGHSFFIVLSFWAFLVFLIYYGLLKIRLTRSANIIMYVFEGISLAWLLIPFIINRYIKNIQTGTFVPILITNIFNLLIVTAINIFLSNIKKANLYIWINLFVIFIHMLITVPLLIGGTEEGEKE